MLSVCDVLDGAGDVERVDGGLFVQVVDDLGEELPIPGKPFGFRTLIAAQAAGDFASLKERGRRIVRVTL